MHSPEIVATMPSHVSRGLVDDTVKYTLFPFSWITPIFGP